MGKQIIDTVYLEAVANDAVKHRKIWFNEQVDEQSVTKCIYLLDKIKRNDMILGEKKPITIVMNSPGGYVYQGLMLISHIEGMVKEGYEIITLTGGMSASMSFLIGLCGSRRKAYKYSTFLCHQPSSGAIGEAVQIRRTSDEVDRLWDISKKIIKEHTKMSDELLDSIYNGCIDYIVDSDKALELGIIDEIV